MIGMPWNPAAATGSASSADGDRLHVQESGDGWKLVLDGRDLAGGPSRAHCRSSCTMKPKTKPAYDCTSPHVTFSAGAGS